MRSLVIATLLLLLTLFAGVGCQSLLGQKDGRSRWAPPSIISRDHWWGEKELGDIGD